MDEPCAQPVRTAELNGGATKPPQRTSLGVTAAHATEQDPWQQHMPEKCGGARLPSSGKKKHTPGLLVPAPAAQALRLMAQPESRPRWHHSHSTQATTHCPCNHGGGTHKGYSTRKITIYFPLPLPLFRSLPQQFLSLAPEPPNRRTHSSTALAGSLESITGRVIAREQPRH